MVLPTLTFHFIKTCHAYCTRHELCDVSISPYFLSPKLLAVFDCTAYTWT
ncbi:Uncharacterized protein APZ42_032165 [Daphnia magna]|uniref:Uncharacterized protein n=1 Tax=Daphnia magna TaxID=35525 RepID=A0A0P5XMD3_9CRUS|nr:Uncharacterized protein APZ42_032165 [Daphnia magna]